MLLSIKVFHSVAGIIVVAELGLVFFLVKLGFVVPQFSFEDVD